MAEIDPAGSRINQQTGKVQLDGASLEWAGGIPTLPLPVNLAITVAAFAAIEGWRKSGEEVPGLPAIFPNGAFVIGMDKIVSAPASVN